MKNLHQNVPYKTVALTKLSYGPTLSILFSRLSNLNLEVNNLDMKRMNVVMKREIKRNIFHLIFGVVLAYLVLFLGDKPSIVLFGTCIVLGLVVSEIMLRKIHIPVFSFFISIMERKDARPGQGAIHFLAGAFIALLFFGTEIVFISLLILALADSFSTIVGIWIGKIKIYKKRTLEGTTAGFIVAFGVCLFYLPVIIALYACLVGSIVELFSPIDDNIAIPPITGVALFILGV